MKKKKTSRNGISRNYPALASIVGLGLAFASGGSLTILNRTKSKAERLASDLRRAYTPPYSFPERQPIESPFQYAVTPGFVSPNPYIKATAMPVLPPGTTPSVRRAVEKAYREDTLTERQAAAVSQLYAPLYRPEVVRAMPGVDYGPGGFKSVEKYYTGLHYSAEDILAGRGNLPDTGYLPPALSEVDFGSEDAANAALDAYFKNFVGSLGVDIRETPEWAEIIE